MKSVWTVMKKKGVFGEKPGDSIQTVGSRAELLRLIEFTTQGKRAWVSVKLLASSPERNKRA